MPLTRLGGEHTVLFTDGQPREFFRSADLVFLIRVSMPATIELVRALRESGPPVVMDFDDNLHSMHADNEATRLYSNHKSGTRIFEEALTLANVVTASTERLRTQYYPFRKDIQVCPNFMPSDIFDRLAPKRIDGLPKRTGEIRVGYVGGSSHGADLAMAYTPLRKLCARHPNVKLVFFGQQLPPLYKPLRDRIEYHEYVLPKEGERNYEFMDRYFERLRTLDLDVAIAPIIPSSFNAAKSYLKALEYGSCGYPVVASSFGPYREYAKMGGPIVTAFDEGEWLRNLSRLVEDAEARRDLAERNATFIRERCSTNPWPRVLESLTLLPA
jgi:glycosyltransferase involved in cell wall biosynthesis